MTAPTQHSRRAARPWPTRRLIGLACVLALALLPAASQAVEEPAFTIVRSFPTFEIGVPGATERKTGLRT